MTARVAAAWAVGTWALACPLATAASPGTVSATAAASPAEVRLGEPFSVFVTVRHPPAVAVDLPAALPLGPAFEEIRRARRTVRLPDSHRSARTSHDGDSDRAWPEGELELELVAWTVGDLAVPPIPVTYADNGAVHAVRTQAIPVRVISVIGDGAPALRDITPPTAVYRRDYTPIWTAGAIALLSAIAIGLWRNRRRRRARARAASRPVSGLRAQSPARDALDRLEALARSPALIDAAAPDGTADSPPARAYREMSEIVRRYLGRRYGFAASDHTTAEIAAHLAGLDRAELDGGASAATPPVSDQVAAWLAEADLVKYAGAGATAADARAALDAARALIRATAHPAWLASEGPR